MARILIILALCTVVPLATPQCTTGKAAPHFRRSVYEFSLSLMRRIAQETDGHFVTSTLSPWALLSAISLGAADETLAEIKKVLGLHAHKCFNEKEMLLINQVTSSDKSATLERSAAVFIDNTVGLKETFRKTLSATGVCEIQPLPFEDFASAARQINDYVRRVTHGVIEDIVTENDLIGVYLMMVDAVYFKGSWRKAFPAENTQTKSFFDHDEKFAGEANFMYVSSRFNLTDIAIVKATVLELPYGDSDKFSMLVFLPKVGVSVFNLIDNLNKISLGSIFTQFKRGRPREVMVQLPRFKISSDLDNLKELLMDMGLTHMFNSSSAKFPLLSDYELYVSSFIQKADIEVTEEGTVAAAVSELGFSFRSSILAEQFVANRPFLFMVVDRQTEVAVFSGAYSNPTLY